MQACIFFCVCDDAKCVFGHSEARRGGEAIPARFVEAGVSRVRRLLLRRESSASCLYLLLILASSLRCLLWFILIERIPFCLMGPYSQHELNRAAEMFERGSPHCKLAQRSSVRRFLFHSLNRFLMLLRLS